MEKNNMQKGVIPVWKRYALTITEAAEYYHIGENKLRMIADEHPEADFIIMMPHLGTSSWRKDRKRRVVTLTCQDPRLRDC